MNEKMKKEIENSLSIVGMTLEEATQKYESICAENNIETSDQIGVALWRSHVAQFRRSNKPSNSNNSSGGLAKQVFGMFVSLDAPRDTMRWKRNRAGEEYRRDADNALENGIVAVATQNALGKWVVARYHKGEYEEKTISSLPEGAEEGMDGQYFIPLMTSLITVTVAKIRGYGKPLPC